MKNVTSNVSGRLIVVLAAVGDQVAEGDELFKVESMKMEIPIETEYAGEVYELLVQEGDEVQEGQALAILR